MSVGIPKEVKNNEYRVAITPSGVHAMTALALDLNTHDGHIIYRPAAEARGFASLRVKDVFH
jgi:hypothetical protein